MPHRRRIIPPVRSGSIVAFTAGGTTDFVARLLADRLKAPLGQSVIVENRPGANGAIAAEYVAKSEPDGYTLFFTTVGAVAINPALRSNLPYDPLRDFAPVGMAVFNSTILVVNAAMQVNSARELAALARETARRHHHRRSPASAPSRISGSSSTRRRPASSSRRCPIAARRRQSPICSAVSSTVCSATSRPSSPRSRPASSRRSPPRRKSAPRFSRTSDLRRARLRRHHRQPMGRHACAGAHPGRRSIAQLNAAFAAALNDPEVRERLKQAGVTPSPSSPEEFGRHLREEIARWRPADPRERHQGRLTDQNSLVRTID